jgi:hypothetical protein
LKWRFWKRDPEPERTTISVTRQNLTEGTAFYVQTESAEKALELMRQLQKKEAGS